ncbi:hypothetical protein BLNAU_16891 [Blattamonas nauphoetae]|uniref:Uncharacterized protein n=1 Tax=Blattamonas nauphoetae TaxID=2049346 RepID=A0ABQ9XAA0_9EUKA|nr:hypothetical protein BLNAU_16891 [Blattamonas nauphoetae]
MFVPRHDRTWREEQVIREVKVSYKLSESSELRGAIHFFIETDKADFLLSNLLFTSNEATKAEDVFISTPDLSLDKLVLTSAKITSLVDTSLASLVLADTTDDVSSLTSFFSEALFSVKANTLSEVLSDVSGMTCPLASVTGGSLALSKVKIDGIAHHSPKV